MLEQVIKHKYKLILAYDGTNYSGWQIQPNGLSIQELLQEKLECLTREKTHVTGAGRTDAGVHALGQVAHFTTEAAINPPQILRSLNGMLPKDIRVHALIEVPPLFHARYSAVRKIYHYHLALTPVENPFNRLYSWHLPYPIDVEKMQKALVHFIGTHDFSSFTNEANRGASARNPIRTIESLLLEEKKGEVCLQFKGNGFLYKMVRNITGTLVEVGAGRKDPSDIPDLILAKDRKKAGKAAPAHGLFLISVEYQEESNLN